MVEPAARGLSVLTLGRYGAPIAAALILGIGAVVSLSLAGTDHERAGHGAGFVGQAGEASAPVDVEHPKGGIPRRINLPVAGAPDPVVPSSASGSIVATAREQGSIEGVALDGDGYPEAGRLWIFQHAERLGRERWARSDALGNVELRGLDVGIWEASYAHTHPAVERPTRTVMTTVEVQPDQVAWVELRGPVGKRSLYGELSVRVEDARYGVLGTGEVVRSSDQDLDLELRPAAGMSGPIRRGRARVVGFRAHPLDKRPDGATPHRPDGPEPADGDVGSSLRKGAFFFTGLEPGRYVLRIVPTGNAQVQATFDDGSVREVALGIEREIDLVLGDVVLEPEVLSMVDDFVAPALAALAAE